jgi:hypothetical protein
MSLSSLTTELSSELSSFTNSFSMNTQEIERLAQAKGCILKALQIEADRSPVYWVENQHFIGKPYACLTELAQFIQWLPLSQ